MRACARCGALFEGKRCARCRRLDDKARGTASARGYDRQWADYARAWLRAYPWCGQRHNGVFYTEHSQCVQQNERTRAEVVDHIVAIRDGGARMDPRNHQSLCTRCNTLKAQTPRGRPRP